MKTLIIVAHPNLEKSVINKRWVEELEKYPKKYIVHNIYTTYPNENIDVAKEQELIESVDNVILQFPFYWFNCPPLMKKWIDKVLSHGWAYGANSGYKMSTKKVALAVSAGIKDEDYQTEGRYKYTLKTLTSPFEITFLYVKADYKPLFTFYGAEHQPTAEDVSKNAEDYIKFLENL